MLKKMLVIIVLLVLTSLIFAQSKDMVITKKDGSKSYVSVDAIDNITFSAEQTGTVTDVDGNVYKTVKIGNQWWMAENLRVRHYRNMEWIPFVIDATEWSQLTTGACCYYGNLESNGAKYGCLYNGYVVGYDSEIAPKGWHIATVEDWDELAQYLGDLNGLTKNTVNQITYWPQIGGFLKSTSGWNNNGNGNDACGFNTFPAGYRSESGMDQALGRLTNFYAISEYSTQYLEFRYMEASNNYLFESIQDNPKYGFSVRCVRD